MAVPSSVMKSVIFPLSTVPVALVAIVSGVALAACDSCSGIYNQVCRRRSWHRNWPSESRRSREAARLNHVVTLGAAGVVAHRSAAVLSRA